MSTGGSRPGTAQDAMTAGTSGPLLNQCAVALGASTVYVLHVGRIESPLPVPTRPWEVGLVAFEIARRHRFHEEMSALPPGVRVHILPAGAEQLAPGLRQFRYRGRKQVSSSMERSYAASASYLAQVSEARPR